ncbi:SGNH/GDSL hydrolase family protein [Phycicoccus flavus]|uniref:SGNH/GDSL hydrolase family protein n=1 Tax=Phycicoccus flavus TaxID=2502783 RepID=UPI000FEB88BD|nr:SGNH/GDSL hydrolase family protein [Phycicoccus flavus]NHA68180.1 hypothetical protein [Phycicoccus flavus]
MPRPSALLAVAAVLALAACSGGSGEAASSAPAPPPSSAASPSSSAASPSDAPTTSSSTSPTDPAAAAGGTYLALGDSLAAGYQPGGTELRDSAYPALAAGRLARDGADLTVENLACSGETTTTFLEGGKCPGRSQMAKAERLLEQNRGEVRLVTIDIGGNDLLRCVDAASRSVDRSCVDRSLRTVRTNLPTIVDRLRAAAGEDVPVLVLGYYNPWLAASYLGEGQQELTVATKAYTDLDTALRQGAKKAGATPVALTRAFRLDDESPTQFQGRQVPTNVAQVCTLTYICTAGDIHLTGEGAAVVGRVVAQAATKAGVG